MSLSLIIDIQSNLISAVLVSADDSKNTQVIYSTTQPIGYKEYIDADYITKMMITAVQDILLDVIENGISQVYNNGSVSVEAIHYILSSPWVVSQPKSVKIDYPKDTEITEKLIKDIIETEKNKIIKDYAEGLVFIEQKIFEVSLNGYSVQSYIGKKTKNIEVSFVLSLSPEIMMKSIREAVSKHIYVHQESCHSSLLLHYMAARLKEGHGSEYSIVHVHGELTDIVIIKKGFSSHFASFPFGKATMVRELSSVMKTVIEEARSTISMYENNKLEDGQKDRVEKALTSIIKNWQSECSSSLSSIGKSIVLPHRIYLSSLGHFNLFKKSLEEAGFEVLALDKPMTIYVLALENML